MVEIHSHFSFLSSNYLLIDDTNRIVLGVELWDLLKSLLHLCLLLEIKIKTKELNTGEISARQISFPVCSLWSLLNPWPAVLSSCLTILSLHQRSFPCFLVLWDGKWRPSPLKDIVPMIYACLSLRLAWSGYIIKADIMNSIIKGMWRVVVNLITDIYVKQKNSGCQLRILVWMFVSKFIIQCL